MRRAGSRTPLNLCYALGVQRETVLCVSLQVRHCCLLPAKRRCVAKSQYDTACSWKLQKGAAGCESVRRGARRDGGGAGSGLGGSRYAFDSAGLPAFPPSPFCQAALMDCLRVLSPPSPLCLRNDTCLLESRIICINYLLQVIFPKPGSGETQEYPPSTSSS